MSISNCASRGTCGPLPVVLLATLALLGLPGAKSGCGTKEANETLSSPVQAVTTLLERPDGTVDAELVLISTTTQPHAFVSSAKNAHIRMAGGDEIPLRLAEPGHYRASSTQTPALTYVPGATYQFRFELDDEAAAKNVAGGSFVAVVDAPDDDVTFQFSELPTMAGDTSTVRWTPTSRHALVDVRNDATNERTYSTFDFEAPHFDGSKWARLPRGGTLELSVDTFPTVGTYTVSFCAVDHVAGFDTSLSAELGPLSGFLIGRCAEEISIDVQSTPPLSLTSFETPVQHAGPLVWIRLMCNRRPEVGK